MSTSKETKINKLLQNIPSGIVLTSNWLRHAGYSAELIRNYKKSRWFESIGRGALKRYRDKIDYFGGIYAIQHQLGLSVHPAAKTAINLQGRAQYVAFNLNEVYVMGDKNERLPQWFKQYPWKSEVIYKTAAFLPKGIGMLNYEYKSFTIQISGAARALMEYLYLNTDEMSLIEGYEIMENLNDFVPSEVQGLLEKCTSVKVKRLFLYLAEKAEHPWFKYLDIDKIELGHGKRSYVDQGRYVAKYKITVPKEIAQDDTSEI